MNFEFRSILLSRIELHEGGLNTCMQDGESLAAIVPFSDSNDVTIVLMSRKPTQVFTPINIDEEDVIELEPVDA